LSWYGFGYGRLVHTITDELRHLNARAASHGYGAGQIEAGRTIEGWSADEAERKASEVLAQVDLAQAYAQEAETDFDDYAQRVTAAGSEPGQEARIAYEAGFDIGYSAALVHGCEALVGQVPLINPQDDAPAQSLDDVGSRL
jgi:hypothetical protein